MRLYPSLRGTCIKIQKNSSHRKWNKRGPAALDPFWGQPGKTTLRRCRVWLVYRRIFVHSSALISVYLWQWDGCFLIALHINFPSWQSHGKDWLNLNCYYGVLMEPVMQKLRLREASHGREIFINYGTSRIEDDCQQSVGAPSPKCARDLTGLAPAWS